MRRLTLGLLCATYLCLSLIVSLTLWRNGGGWGAGVAALVVGDGLDHLAQPRVQRLDLGDEDLVGFADAVDIALKSSGLQGALDQAVEGEAEAKPAHKGGDARAPAAPVPPQRQGDDQ